MAKRYALIEGRFTKTVASSLPANYRVIFEKGNQVVIEGEDTGSSTLEDYVLPHLAKGMNFGEEIDRYHPIMSSIPSTAATLSLGDCSFSILTLLTPEGPVVTLVGNNCKVKVGTKLLKSIRVGLVPN